MRNKLRTVVRKSAHEVSERLPAELKGHVRDYFKTHQDGVLAQAVKLAGYRLPAAKTSQSGPSLLVDPAYVGTTYGEGELFSVLALENSVLRSRLFEALDQIDSFNAARDEAEGSQEAEVASSSSEEEDTAPEPRILTENYLKDQLRSHSKRHLVVANEYPDVGKEYGNGFVHRRVRYYQEAGIDVDVVVVNPSLERRIYHYDGVRVLVGHGPELNEILHQEDYLSVSAHFLNEVMWQHFEEHLPNISLHVFLHGYECDRWIRRIFNLTAGTALERGIDRTLRLQRFWKKVTEHPHQPTSYIFVSQWWRDAVSEDMERVFPASRSAIIHNFIDTEVFNYVPKDASQRFKLLWVRSAANRKYGNDIAIDILKALSKTKYWDQVEATIIGDGTHFHEFEEQLGKFSNVTIEQRFVSQQEVADLHKTHGILLVPSRLDSQGVSRDEAMSSGLVPVTNLVTAIPEFVDESCAVVAGAESAEELARGIVKLFANPELFLKMSQAASERASSQCGGHVTVVQEIEQMGLSTEAEGA